MKMKKLAALALSAVFALGALTACGGSSSLRFCPGCGLRVRFRFRFRSFAERSQHRADPADGARFSGRDPHGHRSRAGGQRGGIRRKSECRLPERPGGDTSTINTICQQFVGNKVDAIVAIATPAAQGAATAVAGTDIPVIFSAVTDPAAAGLVENPEAPEGNITGTSDAIPR